MSITLRNLTNSLYNQLILSTDQFVTVGCKFSTQSNAKTYTYVCHKKLVNLLTVGDALIVEAGFKGEFKTVTLTRIDTICNLNVIDKFKYLFVINSKALDTGKSKEILSVLHGFLETELQFTELMQILED